jgi:hypothetical protein
MHPQNIPELKSCRAFPAVDSGFGVPVLGAVWLIEFTAYGRRDP